MSGGIGTERGEMTKLCIDDLDLKGKRVLLRVDFNVPLEGGKVMDDTRIQAALPTIRYAQEHGAKLLLLSHLGRPGGKVVPSMSLKPVAERLSGLLGQPVPMAEDCIGEAVRKRAEKLRPGEILMLENCRFHAGDEKNDETFSRALAALCDIYVNDAFGAAHRAHASTVGVTRFVPVAACGFLMKREIEYLGRLLASATRPFVALLGGAKVSDKIGVITNLLGKVSTLLIGGGMAYTFLKAQGVAVGDSLVEEEKVPVAKDILKKAEAHGVNLLLPMDHVVAERLAADSPSRVTADAAVPAGWRGLDIGPRTRESFAAEIRSAKTLFWNGPMGVYEVEPFRAGTIAVAEAVAASDALSVVGGGDSVAAVMQMGIQGKITHISTGGGASLEFLEGRELPGVAALTDVKGRA